MKAVESVLKAYKLILKLGFQEILLKNEDLSKIGNTQIK